jgi:acyl-CoA synthetase (AMP-forming)/AMP-acid ligase II
MSSAAGVDELLRLSTQRNPGGIAVIDGQLDVSYARLDRLVDELAGKLASLGAGMGAHCAYLMDHTVECLVAFFAIQRAGYVVVPLNAKLTASEVQQQLAWAEVRIVLTSPSMLPNLRWVETDPGQVQYMVVLPAAGEIAPSLPALAGSATAAAVMLTGEASVAVVDERGLDEPVALWFTSGTTGAPKAVLHSKRSGVTAVTAWVDALELDEFDRGMSLNFFHIAMMSGAVALIAAGGTVVLVPSFKVDIVLELIERHQLTHVSLPPVLLNLIDREPTVVDKYDLSSLDQIIYGSAPLDPELLRRSVERFPVRWMQAWAQTEINSGGTCNRGDSFFERFGSIGLPIGCVEAVAIIDQQGSHLPAGEIGELCVRGPMVMLGYHRNEGATAEALRDGWLHTGDLAYQDADGYLFLKGRKREVIIRGGENVYPTEIEGVLSTHPAVGEVAVVGIPDSVMTEVPVAYVVLQEGATASEDELRAFAAQHLARYKRPVVIEVVGEIPRNAVGKVLKALLSESASRHAR